VFDDKKRTEVYFGILEDFRNPSAHSRELATFERELLSGISTQLRNQVALYRTALDPANAHYPLIESIIDCFGQVSGEGAYNWAGHGKAIQRKHSACERSVLIMTGGIAACDWCC